CSLVASGRLNCLIFTAAGDHRVLLSFPTRRSSDLFHHLILRFCQLIIPVQVVIGAVDCRVQLLAFGLPVILKGGLFDVPAFVSIDRKSTRLNSSHVSISYAVFCLKKKITQNVKTKW